MNFRIIRNRLFPTLVLSLFVLFFQTTISHAVSASGKIDERNAGYYFARFLADPGVGVPSPDLTINFGKFSGSNSPYSIVVDDNGIRGYAWGGIAGWIVFDCALTTNGCNTTNGNFKVSISEEGTLSGYAWGENTGWINFGPFTNEDISRVVINRKGFFQGSLSQAGYAWSEQLGWIVFDCGSLNSCVRAGYTPRAYRPTQVSSGSITQCGDGIDNDNDGLLDMADGNCGNASMSEFTTSILPPIFPSPQTPVVPPTIYDNPFIPEDTVGIPSTTENNLIQDVPQDARNDISDQDMTIGATIARTVSDISTPKTRDALVDMLRNIFAWVKAFLDKITMLFELLMNGSFGKKLTTNAPVGVVLFIITAVSFGLFIPAAGAFELSAYPRLLVQQVKAALGFVSPIKPWGVVYDSVRHVPLVMQQLALRDTTGAVVAKTFSDSSGSFAFRVPVGIYTLDLVGAAEQLTKESNPLFGPNYVPGEVFGVSESVPSHPFSLAVSGISEQPISRWQAFAVKHEVFLTNMALLLFGVGALSALLGVIFYPGIYSITVFGIYGIVGLLRSFGMIGSYATVLIDKIQNIPLTGQLVQIFDYTTKKEVARTLSNRFGKTYIQIPPGQYYMSVSSPKSSQLPGDQAISTPFVSHGGIHRTTLRI